MKRTHSGITAATPCPFATWFSAIFSAAFLTIISVSAAVPQTGAEGMTPAEKWVVQQAAAGNPADLFTQFPEDKDRKLSADFLKAWLTGTLPGLKLHRRGVPIIRAIIDEPINVEDEQIPYDVKLYRCQFNQTVIFARANFAGGLFFNGSKFKAAFFDRVKVGGDAVFDAYPMNVRSVAVFERTVFEGPVYFIAADIAGSLRAQNAKFNAADFSRMSVRGDQAAFAGADFDGPVHFFRADIAQFFVMRRAKLHKEAYFSWMKVGSNADFEGAEFNGAAFFGGADIAGNFQASAAKFYSGANFEKLKLAGDAVFDTAEFYGPVYFSAADIAGNFKFGNKKQELNFNSVEIGHSAFSCGAAFGGPVGFLGANLAGTLFHNQQQDASFQSMRVGGEAVFDGAVFDGRVDLRYADFGRLDLSGSKWPKDFRVQGMSYKYVLALGENKTESLEPLLEWANKASYTADVYRKLEEFFARQGYRADADKSFIAGKLREREKYSPGSRGVREYFRSGDWHRWLGSTILYRLVGYGRRPWQAAFPCAFFVALGCVLFPLKKMTLQDPKELEKPEEQRRSYNRFWYSLGLFLPVVDIKTSELWGPKPEYTFLRNYVRVHILLGWILIPIVLAALTGLIK